MFACLSAGMVSAAVDYTWEQAFLGGGGGLDRVSLSPYDSNLILLQADMGSGYFSRDGGSTWNLLPKSVGWAQHQFCFHPADSKLIFVCTDVGLFKSTDAAATWTRVPTAWDGPSRPWFAPIGVGPYRMAFDPASPDNGIAIRGRKVLVTHNRGVSWSSAPDLGGTPGSDREGWNLNLIYDPNSGNLILGTQTGIYISRNGGESWTASNGGLEIKGQPLRIRNFEGAVSGPRTVLYAVTPTRYDARGKFATCLYKSTNGGVSWSATDIAGLYTENLSGRNDVGLPEYGGGACDGSTLAVSPSHPNVVYLATNGDQFNCEKIELDPAHYCGPDGGHSMIFRSSDGGNTWRGVFYRSPFMKRYNITNTTWTDHIWGWHCSPQGLCVSSNDPDYVVAACPNNLYVSRNGGTTWKAVDSKPLVGDSTANGGIASPGVGASRYLFDPHNYNVRYLATNGDCCFFRSTDGGASWEQSGFPKINLPWIGCNYARAMDPSTPGRVWTACSTFHEIPFWTGSWTGISGGWACGGVARSDDYAKTFTLVSHGLPTTTYPTIDLLLDPTSSPSSRTLWAATYGGGVYRTTNGGAGWSPWNAGLESGNMCAVHICRDNAGKLYLITGLRVSDKDWGKGYGAAGNGYVGGAVYTRGPADSSWKQVLRGSNCAHYWSDYWLDEANPANPVNIDVDLTNPNNIYVAAMQPVVGIWRTGDGGGSWKKVFNQLCLGVWVDQSKPSRIYACIDGQPPCQGGLYVSEDHGGKWTYLDSFPYVRPVGVDFDPQNAGVIYVTTLGGGIWKGTLATRAPLGGVVINSRSLYCASTKVKLSTYASGADGVSEMRFSNDNATWSDWESFASSKAWTLSGGDGMKRVYAQYKNKLGAVTDYNIAATIILDASLPTGGSKR
jgi:photosystem II stability/assembly factor-like uncharacterized protein